MNHPDVKHIIAEAHRMRSAYIRDLVARLFRTRQTVGQPQHS